MRWKPDGSGGETLGGGTALCAGTPHGLRAAREDGAVVFYHANNAATLTKTSLEGDVIWQTIGTPNNDSAFEPYKPTWFAAPPGSPYAYLADGYGSNLIHVFDRYTGAYANHTFGGAGPGIGEFATCHAITYDERREQLVVSDRANHRLQRFDFDESGSKFEFVSQSNVTGAYSHRADLSSKESRRRRGRDADSLAETSRGAAAASLWKFGLDWRSPQVPALQHPLLPRPRRPRHRPEPRRDGRGRRRKRRDALRHRRQRPAGVARARPPPRRDHYAVGRHHRRDLEPGTRLLLEAPPAVAPVTVFIRPSSESKDQRDYP